MSTTIQDLQEWFDRGVKEKATHMIVVCDTFDHEDYPVFVKPTENVHDVAKQYNNTNMQRIMEVYNLRMSKEEQFSSRARVFNY